MQGSSLIVLEYMLISDSQINNCSVITVMVYLKTVVEVEHIQSVYYVGDHCRVTSLSPLCYGWDLVGETGRTDRLNERR